jgi:hypothetical protein
MLRMENIIKEKAKHEGGRLNCVELENGVWLKEVGDGTAFDESENKWKQVSKGIGEPDVDGDYAEYQCLGWKQL